MALSCVELGTRKVRVIVLAVAPCAVAPPLSPVNAGVQFGECPVHVNCRMPAPHFAPVFAMPEAAADGAALDAPGVLGDEPVLAWLTRLAADPDAPAAGRGAVPPASLPAPAS